MKIGSKSRAAAMVFTVLAGSLTTFVASTGQAAAVCEVYHYNDIQQLGSPWYVTIGSRAGKYNAGSSATPLTYARATTSTKSTSWKVEAGGSVGWGIAKVEAKIGRDITKSITTGTTVTNTLSVPPKRYGYTEPKAEYRRYVIYDYRMEPNCKGKYIKTWGTLDAIVTAPFFAECISTAVCTPRP
ncbi:hypothetical protein [Kribbella sp. NPDC006257]|uniref:hypothetical protein n=1 Tax=Kribbella sp. NPDC006257 TaxID=3156738 RepID=UPI0033A176B7